jgi:hypothetical protein
LKVVRCGQCRSPSATRAAPGSVVEIKRRHYGAISLHRS